MIEFAFMVFTFVVGSGMAKAVLAVLAYTDKAAAPDDED